MELEENIKRMGLSWRENVKEVVKLHNLHLSADTKWTQEKTARSLGLTAGHVSNILQVGREIDNNKIKEATSFNQAYNILTKKNNKNITRTLNKIRKIGEDIFELKKEVPPELMAQMVIGETPSLTVINYSKKSHPDEIDIFEPIICMEFSEWVKGYNGKKFNFIHCNFLSDPSNYFNLLEIFCSSIEIIMSASGHLLLWFPMEHYNKVLRILSTRVPFLEITEVPFIWSKSNSTGYETALVAKREGKEMVKTVNNIYHGPTDTHNSRTSAPEPAMRHFLQMFITPESDVFDPMAGNGAALRAADYLGAKSVFGLDPDKTTARKASSVFRQRRALRELSEAV